MLLRLPQVAAALSKPSTLAEAAGTGHEEDGAKPTRRRAKAKCKAKAVKDQIDTSVQQTVLDSQGRERKTLLIDDVINVVCDTLSRGGVEEADYDHELIKKVILIPMIFMMQGKYDLPQGQSLSSYSAVRKHMVERLLAGHPGAAARYRLVEEDCSSWPEKS